MNFFNTRTITPTYKFSILLRYCRDKRACRVFAVLDDRLVAAILGDDLIG